MAQLLPHLPPRQTLSFLFYAPLFETLQRPKRQLVVGWHFSAPTPEDFAQQDLRCFEPWPEEAVPDG